MGTSIGIGNAIGFKNKHGSNNYIDPALKAALVGVWKTKGKSNNDADRDIIKDLTNKGNDLQILNAGYKLNSGHGLYKQDFTDSTKWTNRPHNKVTPSKIEVVSNLSNAWVVYCIGILKEYPSFKVKITGLKKDALLRYRYISENGTIEYFNISIDGIYTVPKSFPTTVNNEMGFQLIYINSSDAIGLTIEQIPDHQGAVVTDGVDDIICSIKSSSELIGDTDSVTIIGIIKPLEAKTARFNFLSYKTVWIDNFTTINSVNKNYIFGYSSKTNLPATATVINTILGDKADVVARINKDLTITEKYYVSGYLINNNVQLVNISITYYGGFIAKGILTTDQINQVIAYYNLDWWIEPDCWYDIKKQGITNENHSEFKDQILDFSTNERHLQANNFRWGLNSGVGDWATDFNSTYWAKSSTLIRTGQTVIFDEPNIANRFLLYIPYGRNIAVPSFTVNVEFDVILYYYYYDNPNEDRKAYVCKRGFNVIPASVAFENPPTKGNVGFYIDAKNNYAKIEQLPKIEGGLWHDGIDDSCISINNFPAYKDFTAILDRQIINVGPGCTVSKNGTSGAFMIDYQNGDYSFGGRSTAVGTSERKVRYVTKYTNSEGTIVPGTNIDQEYNISTGVIRRSDTRFAEFGLYGLLVYPYSMNDFLIERQLKKIEFGTLYPNMIEYRPIITSNEPYDIISVLHPLGAGGAQMITGNYYPKDAGMGIYVSLTSKPDKKVSQITVNGKPCNYGNVTQDNVFYFRGNLDKSPAKISITIENK